MRKIGESYGMPPLAWKAAPYLYAPMEVAETPLGPIRVRQEPINEGATVILPPALVDGAPTSLGKQRRRIRALSFEAAKEAAEERYFLHVRSILSGSWQNTIWKRRTDVTGEHYVGINHFGRWKIGFVYDDGPRMGYVTSPSHTDDTRSPRPYYPHASLNDLKETANDLSVDLGRKAVTHIEAAYRAMVKKDGTLKKLDWGPDNPRGRTTLSVPVGDITITAEKDENEEWLYKTSLPWMVSEPMDDADGDFSEADTDLKSAKQKVEEALQVLAHRFTE